MWWRGRWGGGGAARASVREWGGGGRGVGKVGEDNREMYSSGKQSRQKDENLDTHVTTRKANAQTLYIRHTYRTCSH